MKRIIQTIILGSFLIFAPQSIKALTEVRQIPENVAPVTQVISISSFTPTRVDLSTAAGRIGLELQMYNTSNPIFCTWGSSTSPVGISTNPAAMGSGYVPGWMVSSSSSDLNGRISAQVDSVDSKGREIGLWCQSVTSGILAFVTQHYRR